MISYVGIRWVTYVGCQITTGLKGTKSFFRNMGAALLERAVLSYKNEPAITHLPQRAANLAYSGENFYLIKGGVWRATSGDLHLVSTDRLDSEPWSQVAFPQDFRYANGY